MIKQFMEADGKDYKTVGHKVCILIYYPFPSPLLILEQAFARDGFRCALTGTFDKVSVRVNSEVAHELEAESDTFWRDTVIACHIVKESAMQGVDPSGDGEGGSGVNEVWDIGLPIPLHNLHLSSRHIISPMLLPFLNALDLRISSKHSLRKVVFMISEI